MASRSRRKLVAIILAAGMGTRMNSQIPKVLHSICGTPMIDHVLASLKPLDVSQIYVVTGHLHNMVQKHVGHRARCILQKERLGTAHAVMMVRKHLQGFDGDVLVMCGDAPLIEAESLRSLVQRRRSHHTACAVMTTNLGEPTGYGRVVRNRDNTVRKIVEEKDTNTYEEKINEINTGTYCFDAKALLRALKDVSNDNAQKEYYLTDVVEILNEYGEEVEAQVAEDPTEVIGVNSRRDMAMAERYLRRRILNRIMDAGVTIVDPATTYIDHDVSIGIDTMIHPFTIIQGNTVIGESCEIGPAVTMRDSRIGNNVRVRNAVVEEAAADNDVTIGPYAHVRPGTLLRRESRLGTFVEVARTDLGEKAQIPHLSYLGDAHIGPECYIAAGTMTCNYDGSSTHRTEVGENAFIGANSLLVAPVRVADGAQAPHNSLVDESKAEKLSTNALRPSRKRSRKTAAGKKSSRTRKSSTKKKSSR